MSFRWLRRSPDSRAVLVLIILWLLFFWRFYTPNELDAVSLQEGDFSGQFVAWTAYTVERIREGEIPLWNPYINAGAPHLADPQTAVLYPPRLLTVFWLSLDSRVSGGDIYTALQTEMTLHVLLGVLLMYAFLRRVTGEVLRQREDVPLSPSILGSMMGALVFGFGGFMSAYPQLQLPLLETAIWIPLVLLGIHEATRPQNSQIGWRCMVLAGVALALSLLAGHPQTFLFTGYVAVAYLVYRSWQRGYAWRQIVLALVLLGVVAGGLAAAQWMPTLDYQRQTYRQDLGFDDKSGGFAMQDMAQWLFPDLLGRWSPLYVGILGLVLVGVAIWRRVQGYEFWTGVGALAILLSFGQKTVLYNLVYVILPGFSFFRGQERAAFVIALAGSVLVSLGAVSVLTWDFLADHKPARQLWYVLLGLVIGCAGFAIVFFFLRLIPPNGELYETAVQVTIFALLMAVVTLVILPWVMRQPGGRWQQVALVALLVFDLFSVNMSNDNYESIPAAERLQEPPYLDTIRTTLDTGQRVEGLRGIRDSYGSLYRIADIWGNSPLRLENMEFFLWQIPIERRWELLAVQIVNSEWETVPGEHAIVGTGEDRDGAFNIFRLDDARPFAHMIFDAEIIRDKEAVRRLVADPTFSLRDTILLPALPGELPEQGGSGEADLVKFEPETIEIRTQAETPGVLSLALPYTTGWQATVDSDEVEILEAYGGLSAIYVEAGSHRVQLRYVPWTFRAGSIISLIALLGVIGGLGLSGRGAKRQQNG